MRAYQRIFGAGPLGLLISLALLALAWRLETVAGPAPITANDLARRAVFAVSVAVSVAILVWGVKSLPPDKRGRELVTAGAYRYLRHPVYAAFLSCFNFGLAVLLNDWIYLAWAALVHSLWHWLIGSEEALMRRAFPQRYAEYCKVTGRFVPRFTGLRHHQPSRPER